jgi:hypothetical protein
MSEIAKRMAAEVEQAYGSVGFGIFWRHFLALQENLKDNMYDFPIGTSADEVAMNHCKSAGMIEGFRTVERLRFELLKTLKEGKVPNYAGTDENMQEGNPDGH